VPKGSDVAIPKSSVSIGDLFQPSQFLSCVKFEIAGICIKHSWSGIKIGIKIRVWRPELLVESVKNPGESIVPFVGEVVSKIAQQSLKSLVGFVITSGSQEQRQSNLQFNEVHVYDFPLKNLLAIFFGGLWCYGSTPSWGAIGFFKYFSELDFLEWRFGLLESVIHLPQIATNILCTSPVNPPTCMRYWGAIYPRVGFLPHQSEVVGSAGAVFRAVSNAYIGSYNHIKITPLTWSASRDDKISMLYPKPSGCILIGTNPATWESGRTNPTGEYLWLYWRRITCCIF
jgi:hypothetical protein